MRIDPGDATLCSATRSASTARFPPPTHARACRSRQMRSNHLLSPRFVGQGVSAHQMDARGADQRRKKKPTHAHLTFRSSDQVPPSRRFIHNPACPQSGINRIHCPGLPGLYHVKACSASPHPRLRCGVMVSGRACRGGPACSLCACPSRASRRVFLMSPLRAERWGDGASG